MKVDVKAYIESGILEAYVLDALSPSERVEVETHISQHPELAAEVAEIESAMQSYAEAHAETPPAFMQASALKNMVRHFRGKRGKRE